MHVPADVPRSKEKLFTKNMRTLTKNTEHIFLFAADQKIEHLNADFYGEGIHPDAADPEHVFTIAAQGYIGACATHLGLIARWGKAYPQIPFIAKLNGKTDIIAKSEILPNAEKPDPYSKQLWTVKDVLEIQQNAALNILGVGYTIYLGSTYEQEMLHEAAQIIMQAHAAGLIVILWIYPRGKAVQQDNTFELLAGAAGVAQSLGADVVKMKAPDDPFLPSSIKHMHIIKQAAGNTKVIFAGGKKVSPETFMQEVHLYINQGEIDGVAVGRNVFQHSLQDAIAATRDIAGAVYSIE